MTIFDASAVLLYVKVSAENEPLRYELVARQQDLTFEDRADGVALLCVAAVLDYEEPTLTMLLDALETEQELEVCYIEPASATGRAKDLLTVAQVKLSAIRYHFPDSDGATIEVKAEGRRTLKRDKITPIPGEVTTAELLES